MARGCRLIGRRSITHELAGDFQMFLVKSLAYLTLPYVNLLLTDDIGREHFANEKRAT